jgi:leader peptidase (prepilin peptidase)/N-methyltransferase
VFEFVTAWWEPLLAAPFVGSFLGVLIRRLPARRPVVFARSCCEACGAALASRDLVPVASYLALRGRCRMCRAPISGFHLQVELAAVAVVLIAAAVDPAAAAAAAWWDCGLGWTLLALAWIDAMWMLLPDALTLPLLLAGLAAAWPDTAALTDRAAGAAAGYLAFRAVAYGYRRLRGRVGLGAGDAKLLAAGGAWLGLGLLPALILGGALAGLAFALLAAARGRRLTAASAVPFGPGLALALWLLWLWNG